jgi:oligoendopeptidase F
VSIKLVISYLKYTFERGIFMSFSFISNGTISEDFFPSGKLPLRKDLPDTFTWNLYAIFPDDSSWEESFKQLGEELKHLGTFSGRLFESPETLLEFLRTEEKTSEKMGKVYAFAVMKSHEDTSDAPYQAMSERAGSLYAAFGASLSFFRPEVLAAGADEVEKTLDSLPELGMYRHFFDDILRTGEHVLSPAEEMILAKSEEVARTAENAFSLLTNADMTFPEVIDESGRPTELSEERYYLLSRSRDRRVRKEAFEGLYSTYEKYRNTLAALYSGSIRSDLFYSGTRKYASSLEASLHGDNIPPAVYLNVVEAVNANLDALHGYMKVRKKALGLSELHMYDLNVPLADEPDAPIPYSRAREMVEEGLAPLGDEYLNVLREGFSSRWVDVYENQGKRKGAYSWGSYGTHPYVLLNYNRTLRDVFTIAHEMGHSLHTWFSHRNQPQVYADYTIFLAEVASTTNEALLLESMLEKAGKNEKIFLLNHYLDQVRTTVYRQAMFAEFEMETHALSEKGEALTADLLCGMWKDLNVRFHGPDMTVDDGISVEWGRIPHFYSAFYVYKYVTGFSAAACLSRLIRNGGEKERRNYMRFLSRGSSAYSLEILGEAGVDMTSPEPLEQTILNFREKTALLAELLGV